MEARQSAKCVARKRFQQSKARRALDPPEMRLRSTIFIRNLKAGMEIPRTVSHYVGLAILQSRRTSYLMGNSDERSLVKITFDLDQDEDGYPPVDCEYLWAKPVGGNLYELDNTPFFVRGISTADLVEAEPDEHRELRFKALNRPSGHTTLRVIVFRESSDGRPITARVRSLRQRLSELGCSSELSHLAGLIAVDVPPNIELDAVLSVLSDGEASSLWEYEEAALRA